MMKINSCLIRGIECIRRRPHDSAGIHLFLIGYTQSFDIDSVFSLTFYINGEVVKWKREIREFARTRECEIGCFRCMFRRHNIFLGFLLEVFQNDENKWVPN